MSIFGRLRAGLAAYRPPSPDGHRVHEGSDGAHADVRTGPDARADGAAAPAPGAAAEDPRRPVRRESVVLGADVGAGARRVADEIWTARAHGTETHLALDLTALDLAERASALSVGPAVRALRDELAARDALPDLWFTLVEPWRTLVAPHARTSGTDGAAGTGGAGAPPWLGDSGIVTRAHHAALAHGVAIEALRETNPAVRVGVVLDLAVHIAADEEHGPDLDAVHAANLVRNHLLVGPLLEGALPVELVRETAREADWSVVRPGDLARVRARIDVLGMTPPEAWVLAGRPHPALLESPVQVRRAVPSDAARALHDQLRAFDVAHEGTPLLVDLRGLPDAGGVTRELAERALARAAQDGIAVRVVS